MNTPDSSVVVINLIGGELQISENFYSTSSGSSFRKDIPNSGVLKFNSIPIPSKADPNPNDHLGKNSSIKKIINTWVSATSDYIKACGFFNKVEPFEFNKRIINYPIKQSENNYPGNYRKANAKFSKDDWESFFSSKILDYSNEQFNLSIQDGLPSSLRPYIWINLAHAEKLKRNYSQNMYVKLISKSNPVYGSSISKDIERTFFNDELTSDSKKAIFNILKAYSEFDNEIGYCQGINFLVLQILTVLQDESNSFWMLIYLMRDRGWRNLFLPGTPKLIKLMKHFEIAIKTNLPKLHQHLKKVGMGLEDLCIIFPSYFTTIFSYQVLNSFSVRVWDLFFIKDEQAIVEILINLLSLNEDHILCLTVEVSRP